MFLNKDIFQGYYIHKEQLEEINIYIFYLRQNTNFFTVYLKWKIL